MLSNVLCTPFAWATTSETFREPLTQWRQRLQSRRGRMVSTSGAGADSGEAARGWQNRTSCCSLYTFPFSYKCTSTSITKCRFGLPKFSSPWPVPHDVFSPVEFLGDQQENQLSYWAFESGSSVRGSSRIIAVRLTALPFAGPSSGRSPVNGCSLTAFGAHSFRNRYACISPRQRPCSGKS